MGFVGKKPKGLPFSGRGRGGGSRDDSTLRANRRTRGLARKGRAPRGESVAQKELPGVPEYSVQGACGMALVLS